MKKMLFILMLAFISISIIPCYADGVKVVSIDADGRYSITLTNDGNVWMWGDNMWGGDVRGQLGNTNITTNQCLLPIQSNISNVKAISAGTELVSVLKKDGTVWSWGSLSMGQMGNGKQAGYGHDIRAYTVTPIKAGIDNVKEISVGSCFTDALKNDGTVWEWGDGWRLGLSKDYNYIIWSPIQVNGLSDIKEVKAGFAHTLALDNAGRVWTWGANITNGSNNDDVGLISSPVQVPISDVKAVTAGYGYSLALKNDGTVWGWGDDTLGELGDGVPFSGFASSWSWVYRPTPVMAQGLTDVIAIDSCGELSLALKKDGTVWEWGVENSNKVLTTPTQVPIDNVVAIASGGGHLLALKNDGSVWSWGDNQAGELGIGSKDPSSTPVRVHLDDIQISDSDTAGQPQDESGQSLNYSGASAISNDIISPALVLALAGLLVIAGGIAYYVKKNR